MTSRSEWTGDGPPPSTYYDLGNVTVTSRGERSERQLLQCARCGVLVLKAHVGVGRVRVIRAVR